MKVGGNICFFRYEFLVLGVSFMGNATPNLYSLTFSGLSSSQIFSRCPLVLCMWLKYGLKVQKLYVLSGVLKLLPLQGDRFASVITQGDALG